MYIKTKNCYFIKTIDQLNHLKDNTINEQDTIKCSYVN